MAPFSNEQKQQIMSSNSSRSNNSNSSNNDNNNDNTIGIDMKLSSHSTASTINKVHCVCFDLEPCVREIETVDELPDHIFNSLWFSDSEMQTMISSASKVLDGTNKEDLPRGLEHCSYEGAQRRRVERSKASEAVLGEQLRQKAARACEDAVFTNPDELIAQEYRKVSQRQQELAYERAQKDRADAMSPSGKFRPLAGLKKFFRNPGASRPDPRESLMIQPIS